MGFEGFSRPQKSNSLESTPSEPTLEQIAAEMQRRTNELAAEVQESSLGSPDESAYEDVALQTPEQQEELRKVLERLGKIEQE